MQTLHFSQMSGNKHNQRTMSSVKITNLLIVMLLLVKRGQGSSIDMSTNDLNVAITVQQSIANILDEYIVKSHLNLSSRTPQEDLKYLKSYVTNFQALTKDILEEGFDDPIHAYLLLRHMTVDYEKITSRVTSSESKDLLKNLTMFYMKDGYPTGKDMEAAALSLVRLQTVYDLPTDSLLAKNISDDRTLTGELGSQAVLMMNLKLAHNWFGEGLTLLNSSQYDHDVSEETKNAVISQYEAIDNILSYGNMFEGLLTGAVRNAPTYLLDMVNFIPGLPNNFFQKMKGLFSFLLNLLQFSLSNIQLCIKFYGAICRIIKFHMHSLFFNVFSLQDPKYSKELICAYVRGSHPRFILSPNKVEILSFDPIVAMYHDIVTEKEMNYLKSVSKDKLIEPKTKSSKDLEEMLTFARTGKMAFLSEDSDFQLQGLSDRIADVVNYGIGGHYEVHCDYFSFNKRDMSFPGGDRLATMLFYLNDVKAGGYTVFPVLKIGVQPKKGSALFWYNLKKSGDGDPQTVHAACPILSGTKWSKYYLFCFVFLFIYLLFFLNFTALYSQWVYGKLEAVSI
ncbi:Prolyl 4-hydroxylase subunit alpha-2 [Nymphon striatum]|nr:Prolyl 4-hydroxylase subunit alpha-2 [Nymphon striatum]